MAGSARPFVFYVLIKKMSTGISKGDKVRIKNSPEELYLVLAIYNDFALLDLIKSDYKCGKLIHVNSLKKV